MKSITHHKSKIINYTAATVGLVLTFVVLTAATPIKNLVFQTSVDAGGNNITNLAAPTNPADAATKGYVDASLVSHTGATNLFSANTNGLVPASGMNSANFLRGDGSWQAITSFPGTITLPQISTNGAATNLVIGFNGACAAWVSQPSGSSGTNYVYTNITNTVFTNTTNNIYTNITNTVFTNWTNFVYTTNTVFTNITTSLTNNLSFSPPLVLTGNTNVSIANIPLTTISTNGATAGGFVFWNGTTYADSSYQALTGLTYTNLLYGPGSTVATGTGLNTQVIGINPTGATTNSFIGYNGSSVAWSSSLPIQSLATNGAATNKVIGFNGTTAAWMTSATGSSILSFRNRIIDGDMRIAQRGTSFTVANTASVTSANYTLDRWYCIASGGTPAFAQAAGSSPFPYTAQITGASGVTALTLGQRIESNNIQDLAGSTVTLSAYLKSSTLTSVTWTAYYANSADSFGTKTSIATGTFTINSTLTQYSTPISLPSNAVNGVAIEFSTGAFTGGTLTVTGVQLEPGTTVTTFEELPTSLELSMCQRYYWQGKPFNQFNFSAYTTGCVGCFTVSFHVTMRATPTLGSSITGATYNGCSLGSSGQGATPEGFAFTLNSTSATGNAYCVLGSSDYFTASAEL